MERYYVGFGKVQKQIEHTRALYISREQIVFLSKSTEYILNQCVYINLFLMFRPIYKHCVGLYNILSIYSYV